MQAQSWWYVSDLIRSSCIPQSLSGRVTTALCSITTQVLYRFTYTSLDQIHTFSPLLWLFLGLNYDIIFFCSSSPVTLCHAFSKWKPNTLYYYYFLLIFYFFFNAERDIQDDTLFFFLFLSFFGGWNVKKNFLEGGLFFVCLYVYSYISTGCKHPSLPLLFSLSLSQCVCCMLGVWLIFQPTTNKLRSPLLQSSKGAGGRNISI